MTVELKYPHIEKPTDAPARLERTPRVRVAQIAMEHLAHGWSAEELCRQHPYLTPAEAHAALLYYYDHQAEIDREIEDERQEYQLSRANAPPTPFLIRMRANGRVID